jgi:hypothetical protein
MEALINLRRTHQRDSAGYLPKLIEWQVEGVHQLEKLQSLGILFCLQMLTG